MKPTGYSPGPAQGQAAQVDFKDRLFERWTALKTERSTWFPHWQELSTNIQPRLGQFLVTDQNKGQKRHNNIYDSTGTRALRILAAGMMAGVTSPARPWFRLSTQDPELAEFHSVKLWLADVRRIMLDIFARSNTYRALQTVYEELGCFGTAATIPLTNFDTVIHHYPTTIGQYCVASDPEGRVNTLFREMSKTVSELVREFGWANVSITVKNLWNAGNLDAWVPILHVIEPRYDRDKSKADALNMPYRSCYFEQGSAHGEYLREGGFLRFRPLVPRWQTNANDIYGYSPGMEALGDIKQLQHEQLRKAQGIDYMTKPPLQVPTAMKGREINQLPGGVNYIDGSAQGGSIGSLFEVRLDLNHLLADIQDVRGRIEGAFYADLFLMLAQTDKNMTATEVAERHEEKLLMLGPVLERLHDEMLSPLVAGTFEDALRAGILPPPPPELGGVPVRVEFISMLAQAQRAVSTGALDRYVGTLGTVAQFKPQVLDKFDQDKWADAYADALGVDPELIISTEDATVVREERAKQQAAAERSAALNQTADTAQKLGTVQTKGGASNATNDIMSLFSGYASPPAETY